MRELPKRALGTTGLVVSRIGLGMAALGRPAYINLGHGEDLEGRRDKPELRAHTAHVLDTAYDSGIRYFDAARSYGLAESFLASWIDGREGTLHDITVGSKWGYTYVADWELDAATHEVKDHSLATLDRQFHESLAELGANLDVYQVHSATLESGVLDDPAVLGRLGDLRDEGLVIGATVTGPHQAEVIRRAIEVESGGRPLFATIQATWNLIEPSAGAALAEAHAAGVGIIVKETLANGRLVNPGSETAMELRHAVHEQPLDGVALAAALVQPWADVVLSGATTIEQLLSNLAAFDIALDDDLPDLTESPEEYWTRRAMLRWT